MGKTSTKLVVYALVQLLLSHLSGLVATNHFIFFDKVEGCFGVGLVFSDTVVGYCYPVEQAGSVQALSDRIVRNLFFRGGACAALVATKEGNACVTGGGYTGAAWVDILGQSLLADDAETYEASTNPIGIAYSEDSTKGHWILTTDNATEMYTQIGNIPSAQKVDWLQARGATFKPHPELGAAARKVVTVP